MATSGDSCMLGMVSVLSQQHRLARGVSDKGCTITNYRSWLCLVGRGSNGNLMRVSRKAGQLFWGCPLLIDWLIVLRCSKLPIVCCVYTYMMV